MVFNLDTEVGARRALGNLRNCAKSRLAKTVVEAVKKYSSSHGQQLPAELADLKPYLDPRIGDSFLERYELRRNGGTGENSALAWSAVEKTTADERYDTRHEIGAYGYTVHLVETVKPGAAGKPQGMAQ
jgi:hypothetical protein